MPRPVLEDILRRAMPFNLDYDVARVCREWAEVAYAYETVRYSKMSKEFQAARPNGVVAVAPHMRVKN